MTEIDVEIKNIIHRSIAVKEAILNDSEMIGHITRFKSMIVNVYRNGGKVLFCGNGGSAADAQHIAAELSGRFYLDRKPLAAEALHCNSSYMTSVSNDYGFDYAFARAVEASGHKDDILVGISTSGNSANIIKSFIKAREMGILTIGMTGESGGKLASLSDLIINVPSNYVSGIIL